jgi:hypothetical protein
MANEAHVYFINEANFVSHVLENSDNSQSFEEWLARYGSDPFSLSYDYLSKSSWDNIGSGIMHVTYFRRGWGWFPDRDEIARHYPGLLHRLITVDYFEYDGRKDPMPTYTQGSDYPDEYEGWLRSLNKPGWQFFTNDEMNEMVQSAQMLVSEGESPYLDSWQELIAKHCATEYDFALFTYDF